MGASWVGESPLAWLGFVSPTILVVKALLGMEGGRGDALAEINSTRACGEGEKNLLATDLEFAKK